MNVDETMTALLAILDQNPEANKALIHTAKDLVARLDYGKIVC